MAPAKKLAPKPKPEPPAESPAAHDLALHTAARADGLDQGPDPATGRRISYAVRGCAVCEALVVDGFSVFPPDRRGPPNETASVLALPVNPVPLTAPADLESSGAALQAVMAAAEEIKPGLAEKLVPFFEMALSEIAASKAAEQAEVQWREGVARDIAQIKEAISVLHNNMAHIYKIETEHVLVDLLRLKRALNLPVEK